MVGDVVCVLSCKVLIFSQTASGILLCSVCSQFGEASVKRCFASLFQTAIISMLQVRSGRPTAILVLLQSHYYCA